MWLVVMRLLLGWGRDSGDLFISLTIVPLGSRCSRSRAWQDVIARRSASYGFLIPLSWTATVIAPQSHWRDPSPRDFRLRERMT